MQLVDDWKSSLRWHSVRVFGLLAMLPVIWAELPQETRDMLPEQYRPWIMSGLALIGVLVRLRKQKGV